MFQTARGRDVRTLIDQLRAGAPPPTLLHEGARLYFPLAVAASAPGRCVVCATPLVGRQQWLCAGHWDWVLFEPLEVVAHEMFPVQAIIEFLEIILGQTSVWTSPSNHDEARDGDSRCEVCNAATPNVETLRSRYSSVIKEHIVCSAHRTFRWEDEEVG